MTDKLTEGRLGAILDRIEVGDCWEWIGPRFSDGYGMGSYQGRYFAPHRATWEELVGPIPDGLQMDHLCRNRACVNPDHLETVTLQENIRRGMTGQNMRSKTHCPQGHPYAGEHLYVTPDGKRRCRTCTKDRQKALRAGRVWP